MVFEDTLITPRKAELGKRMGRKDAIAKFKWRGQSHLLLFGSYIRRLFEITFGVVEARYVV